jgi:hypothetical protein
MTKETDIVYGDCPYAGRICGFVENDTFTPSSDSKSCLAFLYLYSRNLEKKCLICACFYDCKQRPKYYNKKLKQEK